MKAVLVVVLVVVMVVPVGWWASGTPGGPVQKVAGPTLKPSVSAHLSEARRAGLPSVSPSVAYTLDLCTNTLYTGNAFPTGCGGAHPDKVAYDSGKGEVFVANEGSNNVSVISDSSNRVVASIPVGVNPQDVAYDSGKGEVFVSNGGSNNVSVISDSSNTVVATVNVGSDPNDVAHDSGKGEVFVANWNSNNVSVISDSSNTVVATVSVGVNPWGVAYDSGKGEVFVTNWGSNSVSVISDGINTVVATVSVGAVPEGVAYDSGKGEVFVANNGAGTVSVISDSSNTVVATVNVGSGPIGVAYDGGKGEVFVANGGSNNVSVISDSSNTVVATVTVGASPYGMAYGSANSYVYVSNSGQGTISIINDGGRYPVTFTESGLPAGTAWSVTVNGSTNGATTASIGFSEPNGTYSFSVGSVPGYTASPSSGTVTVNGAAAGVTITFTQVTYSVTFTETGLPPGTNWSVTLNGAAMSSTTVTIIFTEPNGTYAFTVGSVAGYSSIPSSGSITVSGAAQAQSIAFSSHPPSRYSVTFSESGLPSGTTWSVTFNGTTQSSTMASMVFSNYLNGTYNFTVGGVAGYSVTPSSGSVTINGANKTQAVSFTPLPQGRYSVTFTESGLPSGTSWSVTFNGSLQSSTTTSIVFNNYLNNTYTYTVGAVAGYTANMTSGSVTISGASKIVSITFTPSTATTYAVTFSESGLPSGTSWSVTLRGSSKSGTGSLAFTEPNGTYSFSAGAITGYSASPSSGAIKVNGAAVSQSVTFTALPPGQYSLIFSETGLPAGTNWSVTVGSTTHSSTGTTVSFAEVNGTYHYTVGGVTGYTVSSSGNATVNGASKSVPITFSKSHPSQVSSSVPFAVNTWILIIAVALGTFALILFLWSRSRRKPGVGKPSVKSDDDASPAEAPATPGAATVNPLDSGLTPGTLEVPASVGHPETETAATPLPASVPAVDPAEEERKKRNSVIGLTECPMCRVPLEMDMTCPQCEMDWSPRAASPAEAGSNRQSYPKSMGGKPTAEISPGSDSSRRTPEDIEDELRRAEQRIKNGKSQGKS